MNVSEARRLTEQNSKIKPTHNVQQIYNLITKQALAGEDCIIFPAVITNETFWELEKEGYKIESRSYPTKDNPYQTEYIIKW